MMFHYRPRWRGDQRPVADFNTRRAQKKSPMSLNFKGPPTEQSHFKLHDATEAQVEDAARC